LYNPDIAGFLSDANRAETIGAANSFRLEFLVASNNGKGGGVCKISLGGNLQQLFLGSAGELVRNGAPMESSSNFEIASISKIFTATTCLLMCEDGLLDLDQSIVQYVPSSLVNGLLVINGHDYGPELTLRQLLSHTSGLPDYWSDPPFVIPGMNAFLWDYLKKTNRLWKHHEVFAYVDDLNPRFVPGTSWQYSDSNYVLAGMIIENVTGKTLEEVFQQRIYQALGIEDTWMRWFDQPPSTPPSQSHRYEGSSDLYSMKRNSADWAGGGLVSSCQDLEMIIDALARGKLFEKPSTIAAMKTWVLTGEVGVEYGLGLFRVDLGNQLGWVWGHEGYGSSWAFYYPTKDAIFTGTLNQTNSDFWPLLKAVAAELN